MQTESFKNIRFAVAGFGNIGRRHAEEISQYPHATLAAIVETDANAAAVAKEMYGLPVYQSIQELADKHDDIDIVNICTPNGLHIPMATQAIAVGKHVLVEKPMGILKIECDALMQIAANKGKEVFCVLQNRYSPPSRFINRMLREERLGKIHWVTINCYWNRDQRYYTPGSWRGSLDMDGGPLYTQFSHFVDLLHWCFGPMHIKDARFYNNNHPYLNDIEDTGFFNFDLDKGGAGLFSYSTSVHQSNLESSIAIIGEKGTIKAGGQYMEKITYFDVDGIEAPDLGVPMPPNDYGQYQGSAANHSFVIDNVVKALNGQPFEMATAAEAAASVAIIEEAYKFRKL